MPKKSKFTPKKKQKTKTNKQTKKTNCQACQASVGFSTNVTHNVLIFKRCIFFNCYLFDWYITKQNRCFLPSKVSRCGSPPPFADILSQYSPSHPPKHSHSASHSGNMTGFPFPEHSVKSRESKHFFSKRYSFLPIVIWFCLSIIPSAFPPFQISDCYYACH